MPGIRPTPSDRSTFGLCVRNSSPLTASIAAGMSYTDFSMRVAVTTRVSLGCGCRVSCAPTPAEARAAMLAPMRYLTPDMMRVLCMRGLDRPAVTGMSCPAEGHRAPGDVQLGPYLALGP